MRTVTYRKVPRVPDLPDLPRFEGWKCAIFHF